MNRHTSRHRQLATIAALGVAILGIHLTRAGDKADPPDSTPLENQVAKLRQEVATLRAEFESERVASKLRGLWDESSFVKAREKQSEPEEVSWRLENDVESNRLVLAAEVSEGVLGTMTVDGTKNPVWVTFRRVLPDGKVRVRPGIARYEYKQLTLALPEADVPEVATGEYKQRPTSFESTKLNGVVVYNLVRRDYRRTGR